MDNLESVVESIKKRQDYELPNKIEGVDLESIDFRNLLVRMFQLKGFPLEHFMFGYIEHWKSLSYSDWLYILDNTIANVFKKPTALDTFFIFTYKFLEVNFLENYAQMLFTNQDELEMQEDFLSDFTERPGRLCFDTNDQTHLNSFNLELNDLTQIGENLVKQGAFKAEPIRSMTYEGKFKEVEMYSVYGDPPKSWSWIDKFEGFH